MNTIYKVIYCKATQTWVAVSEIAKGQGKSRASAINSTTVTAFSLKVPTLAVLFGLGGMSNTALAEVYINNNTDGKCARSNNGNSSTGGETFNNYGDSDSNSTNQDDKCKPFNNVTATNVANAQTNRVLFWDENSTTNASFGGDVYINNGKLNMGGANQNSIAIGNPSATNGTSATGNNSIAIGANAGATKRLTTAVGSGAKATGDRSTAIGDNAQALTSQALALGSGANAEGFQSIAVGNDTTAHGAGSFSLGGDDSSKKADGGYSDNDILKKRGVVRTTKEYRQTTTYGPGSTAVAIHAQALSKGSTAIGVGATAGDGGVTGTTWSNATSNIEATAIGALSHASAQHSTAVGANSEAKGINSASLGYNSTAYTEGSIAIGENAVAGVDGSATNLDAIAIGTGAQATGNQSISIGYGNVVSGNHSGAFGDPSTINGANSYSVGNTNTVASSISTGAFVLGNSVDADVDNSVYLGNNSHATATAGKTKTSAGAVGTTSSTAGTGAYNSATIGTGTSAVTYSGFAGTTPTGLVTVGASGSERRIQNVAAGEISATSTDAINGSQLYSVANALDRENYFHVNPTSTTATGNTTNLDDADGIGGATGAYAIATGVNATSKNLNTIAIGTSATAGNDETGFGKQGNFSIAMGAYAQATERGGIAIGSRQTNKAGTTIREAATSSGRFAVAIGTGSEASGENSTALGDRTEAQGLQSVALGSLALAKGSQSMAIGNNTFAINLGSIAFGGDDSDFQPNVWSGGLQLAYPSSFNDASGKTIYYGDVEDGIGQNITATGTSATAANNGRWRQTLSGGVGATAIGTHAQTLAEGAVAIGIGATAGKYTGANANNPSLLTAADFNDANTSGERATAIGAVATAQGEQSTAIGVLAKATGDESTAIGSNTQSKQRNSSAFGYAADADAVQAVAIGDQAQVTGTSGIAIGAARYQPKTGASAQADYTALTTATVQTMPDGRNYKIDPTTQKVVFEYATADYTDLRTKATGESSIALGVSAQATGTNSISIGTGNIVSGNNSGALGDPSYISGTGTYTIGNDNGTAATPIAADNAGAFGNNNLMSNTADNSRIIGNSNNVTQENAFVLGNSVTADVGNSVYLGTDSHATATAGKTKTSAGAVGTTSSTAGTGAYNSATIGTGTSAVTYSGFAGATPTGVVSVGASGSERRIQNVAAGEISATSTDAINGSQLYSVAQASDRQTYFHANDADATNDTNTNTTNYGSVDDTAGAQGINSVAAGIKARAMEEGSVAIGENAWSTAEDGYAMGANSRARGENSIALGTGSAAGAATGTAASKQETIAIGNNTKAYAAQAITIGSDLTTSGSYGIAIGSNTNTNATTSSGYAGVAIGSGAANKGAMANGDSAVAIGGGNEDSTGLDGAVATGDNSVALGSGSVATPDGSVALGSQSNADEGASTVSGYDASGATHANTDSTWFGTAAAVSVGDANASTSITRRITDVAAGLNDTDAVNVAQLKTVANVANSGFNIDADNRATGLTAADNVALGQTVKFTSTDSSINTTVANNEIQLALNADNTTVGTVYTDNVTGQLLYAHTTTSPLTGTTTTYTDAGGNVVTPTGTLTPHIAAFGALTVAGNTNADTDHGRYGDTAYSAGDGTQQQLGETLNIIGATTAVSGITRNTDTAVTGDYSAKNVQTVISNGEVQIQLAENPEFTTVNATNRVVIGSGTNITTLTSTANGLDVGNKITNVSVGAISSTSKDAINGSQLYATGNSIAGLIGGSTTQINATTGVVSFGDATSNGIGNTGKNTIHDAIQSINTATTTANSGFTIAGNSDVTGTPDKIIKPTDTFTVAGDSGNTNFSQSDAGKNIYTQVSDNKITVALANNLDVTSVKAQTVNATTSVTIGDTSGNNTVLTSTANGLDVGGDKITNVAAGTISSTSTDAINGGQLHNIASKNASDIFGGNATVASDGSTTFTNIGNTGKNTIHEAIQSINTATTTANSGFKIAGNSDVAGTPDKTIKPTDTFTVAGDSGNTNFSQSDAGKNIYTQVSDNKITVALANNLDVTSVKAQTVNATTSVTIGDTSGNSTVLTSTANGLNVGGDRITNVSSGLVDNATGNTVSITGASGSTLTNVANIGDLQKVQSSVSTVSTIVGSSGNTTADQKRLTTYSPNNRSEKTDNTIISAIQNMNEGGIKYFHTNDTNNNYTTSSTNTEDSQAGGAYSTAIGYQASTSGTNALAIGVGAQATGTNSISIGTGNEVSGNNSGAIGDPSIVSGANSYSIGNNNTISSAVSTGSFVLGNSVNATVDNSVYLGNNTRVTAGNGVGTVNLDSNGVAGNTTTAGDTGTVNSATVNGVTYGGFAGATANGAVSVGASGSERRIQNVAAGEVSPTSTDAVNGSQLYSTMANANSNIANLYNTIGEVRDDANAGIAAAIATANLPQPHDPGANMTSFGVGHHNGESALSIGVSSISDNGRWVLKGSFTQDTQSNQSVGAGVGFQW